MSASKVEDYLQEEEDYFHAKDYWQDYSPTASKVEDYLQAYCPTSSKVEDYLQDYSRTPLKKRIIFMQRIIDRIILLQTLVRLRRRELLPCKGLLTGLFSYSLESRGLFTGLFSYASERGLFSYKGLLAGLLSYSLESRGLFTGEEDYCKGLLTGLFSYSLESRGLFQDYVRTPPKKRIIFKGLLAGLFLQPRK